MKINFNNLSTYVEIPTVEKLVEKNIKCEKCTGVYECNNCEYCKIEYDVHGRLVYFGHVEWWSKCNIPNYKFKYNDAGKLIYMEKYIEYIGSTMVYNEAWDEYEQEECPACCSERLYFDYNDDGKLIKLKTENFNDSDIKVKEEYTFEYGPHGDLIGIDISTMEPEY